MTFHMVVLSTLTRALVAAPGRRRDTLGHQDCRGDRAAIYGYPKRARKNVRRCMQRLAITLIIPLVAASHLLAQSNSETNVCGELALPPNPDTVDRLVVRVMREKHMPGLSLALVLNGRADKLQSYGWADLESCVPATNATRFGIGSISKQFAAAGALLLARSGRMSLADPITKYLPEGNGVWDGITIRHLLTHTSGIKDYTGDDNKYERMRLDRTSDPPTADLVRQIAAAPVNFLPGDDWAYSNTGYLLLSALIERASGQSFPAYMHDRVFAPLGMSGTRFYSPRELIPQRATPYHVEADATITHGDYIADQFSRWGDAGMISTGPDMAHWVAAMDSVRLLTGREWEQMRTPVRLNDGSVYPYGFGLDLGEVRQHSLESHGGTFRVGYSAYLLRVPARGVTVVVLSNHYGAGFPPRSLSEEVIGLMDRVLASVTQLPARPDTDSKRTQALFRLLSGADETSGAIRTTSVFRHLVGADIRDFAKNNPDLRGLVFLECTRPSPAPVAALGTAVTQECSYRLDGARVPTIMTFWLTPRNELAGFSAW